MKLNKLRKPLLVIATFFVMGSMLAQEPENPDEALDPGNAPLNPPDPAPISDYLIPMLVVGVATAFVLIKRQAPTRA